MPLKIIKKAKPIEATVVTQHADGSQTDEHETLGWKEGPATVSVSMGMTKPLAPYENIKFQVFISMPSQTDDASLEESFQFCKGWVETRVDSIHSEILELVK